MVLQIAVRNVFHLSESVRGGLEHVADSNSIFVGLVHHFSSKRDCNNTGSTAWVGPSLRFRTLQKCIKLTSSSSFSLFPRALLGLRCSGREVRGGREGRVRRWERKGEVGYWPLDILDGQQGDQPPVWIGSQFGRSLVLMTVKFWWKLRFKKERFPAV